MRGPEGVVLALAALREARDAAELAQRGHALAAAGQDLVRVALVADVPDQAVARRVEDVVQRDRELDRAEVRRQVAAGARDRLQDEVAQLAGQLRQPRAIEGAHLGRVVDGGQQRPGGGVRRVVALRVGHVGHERLSTIRSASSRSLRPASPSGAIADSAEAWSAAARRFDSARPSTDT